MFQTTTLHSLRQTLDANALRQRVIASNVSNINTEGYKTKDVNFEAIFDASRNHSGMRMSLTHENHMQPMDVDSGMSDIVFNAYNPANADDGINDVDIDREMVKNSETSMNITMFTTLLKSKYKGIREAIDAPLS